MANRQMFWRWNGGKYGCLGSSSYDSGLGMGENMDDENSPYDLGHEMGENMDD